MENVTEYSENITNYKENGSLPWLYDISVEDTNWIITSSFMIFTMQTGFGMLESGCVSIKNEVNIMMKNVADIVLGGLTYWIFGFAFSFGRGPLSNGFIAIGDFCIDPTLDEPLKGAMYAAFIFQLSFATTATTIVSGAMAESLLNTIVYCIPAGWVWGEQGFLSQLGAVDIAGSGAVHLVGGAAAMASAMMLGPRLGRYDNGIAPLPLGNPVNAVMGLFVLWWGWLAFNSGSTYGLSGAKWHYAARAAVMTMISSFGGGTVSIAYSLTRLKGKIDTIDVINGILGSLVAITAGCFLYAGVSKEFFSDDQKGWEKRLSKSWEALLIGAIGALLVCVSMPLFDKAGIDDPVGASAVHGIGGIWGVLAVGLFAENPYPLDTTSGRNGLFKGGGWYLLGIQTLTCVCLTVWSMVSSMVLLWCINKVVTIRMGVHEELIGADLTEHSVKHGHVGVSRALSALKPIMDTSDIENFQDVGGNPGHLKSLAAVKEMAVKRRLRLSRIFRELTKRQNFGINVGRKLFPKEKRPVKKPSAKPKSAGSVDEIVQENVANSENVFGQKTKNLAWID